MFNLENVLTEDEEHLMMPFASDSQTVCWRSTSSQPTCSSTPRQYDAATYEYYVVRQTDCFYVTFLHGNHFKKEFLEVEASTDV
jgi:hypothetical protein